MIKDVYYVSLGINLFTATKRIKMHQYFAKFLTEEKLKNKLLPGKQERSTCDCYCMLKDHILGFNPLAKKLVRSTLQHDKYSEPAHAYSWERESRNKRNLLQPRLFLTFSFTKRYCYIQKSHRCFVNHPRYIDYPNRISKDFPFMSFV